MTTSKEIQKKLEKAAPTAYKKHTEEMGPFNGPYKKGFVAGFAGHSENPPYDAGAIDKIYAHEEGYERGSKYPDREKIIKEHEQSHWGTGKKK